MVGKREPAAEQLSEFKASKGHPETLTTSDGAPIGNKLATQTVGQRGPVLLQDSVYLDETAHFDRERIPERVVHAKGAGAHGHFEVTHDLSRYTKASIFSSVGKRTPLFIRFSTVGGESGSADTARDPRGFAIKFYTDEGNWDLVGNNTPIFFIRDPIFFPSFIHTQKRNPSTHLKDPDMFWDFLTLRQEATHQVMFLFGDRGTPDGYRHMNGYGSHTFKLVNAQGEATYVKFHLKTAQGIRNLSADQAGHLSGEDPDYSIRDLYNSIARGEHPKWNMFVQLMTFAEAEASHFNPFDLTKIWPQADYPLHPVGTLTLDKNPDNYFAEVEQAAFAPSHMVPGIEPSPDRMLQGRLFSYVDTHFHRLGANYRQIPINCPYRSTPANMQRDGPMTVTNNQAGAPNYHPNSFHGPVESAHAELHKFHLAADVAKYNSHDEDNFSQPGVFWRKTLDEPARARLVANLAGHMKAAAPFLQERAVEMFGKVDPEMGQRLKAALDEAAGRTSAGTPVKVQVGNGAAANGGNHNQAHHPAPNSPNSQWTLVEGQWRRQ